MFHYCHFSNCAKCLFIIYVIGIPFGNQPCHLFTYPSTLYLILYTYLHPIGFLSLGKVTNSKISLTSNVVILFICVIVLFRVSIYLFKTNGLYLSNHFDHVCIMMNNKSIICEPSHKMFYSRGFIYFSIVIKIFQGFICLTSSKSDNWKNFLFFIHTFSQVLKLTIHMRMSI